MCSHVETTHRARGLRALVVLAAAAAGAGVAACGSAKGATGGAGATGATGALPTSPTSPIAGAAAAPLDPSDPYGDSPRVVIDPRGKAIVVWEGKQAMWSSLFDPATGWSAATRLGAPAALVDPFETPADLLQLQIDADGNVTAAWQIASSGWVVKRSVAGAAWKDLPAPPSGGKFVAGPHGSLAVVGIARPYSPNAQLIVSRYDPAGGWSAAETLAQAPTQLSDRATNAEQVIASDGTLFVDWGMPITGPLNPTCCVRVFERYVPGSGWTGPTKVEMGALGSLYADDHGGVLSLGAASIAAPDGGYVNLIASRYFSAGAWGPLEEVPFSGEEQAEAVGRSGVGLAVAIESGMSAAYFTPGGGWKRVDLPTVHPSYIPLNVGVDAKGTGVVAWVAFAPEPLGYIPHLFCARYAADTGWTPPVQVDADGASKVDAFPVLANNDDGTAVVVWPHRVDADHSAIWAAPLP